MSDPSEQVRVKDRRRFDAEGNPLADAPANDAPAGPAENASEPLSPQPESAEAKAPAVDPKMAELSQELEAARKRVNDLAAAYQALQRDREDFKLRLTRERERLIDVEKGNVARTLLEAIDELDRCLVASESDTSPLAQGVRLIRENLLTKLNATGIERLKLVGTVFDPNVAEAGDMEVTPHEADDQKVVAEIQAGYRLKDRVIRPARVKVAKYVRPADA